MRIDGFTLTLLVVFYSWMLVKGLEFVFVTAAWLTTALWPA